MQGIINEENKKTNQYFNYSSSRNIYAFSSLISTYTVKTGYLSSSKIRIRPIASDFSVRLCTLRFILRIRILTSSSKFAAHFQSWHLVKVCCRRGHVPFLQAFYSITPFVRQNLLDFIELEKCFWQKYFMVFLHYSNV